MHLASPAVPLSKSIAPSIRIDRSRASKGPDDSGPDSTIDEQILRPVRRKLSLGIWNETLMLSPGNYEYKFLIDG